MSKKGQFVSTDSHKLPRRKGTGWGGGGEGRGANGDGVGANSDGVWCVC